jgi:hypothetical protein
MLLNISKHNAKNSKTPLATTGNEIRRHRMKFITGVVIIASLLFSPCAGFARDSFILGVAPHTSARVILEMYQGISVESAQNAG